MLNIFKKYNNNLDANDVRKFYCLRFKMSPLATTTGVLSKNFKQLIKYLKSKYDKSYTILVNSKLESVVVVKDEFLEKYIVFNNLQELIDSEYTFRRYI